MILSTAMMLQYSFNLPEEAKAIEEAVKNTIESGVRTRYWWERRDKGGGRSGGSGVGEDLEKVRWVDIQKRLEHDRMKS